MGAKIDAAYNGATAAELAAAHRRIAELEAVIAELRERAEEAEAERDQHRKLSGQANYLLARIVAIANISAIEGADGFVASYDMPVGPIHKAIPFLSEQGIVVTLDGRILNCPEAIAALSEDAPSEKPHLDPEAWIGFTGERYSTTLAALLAEPTFAPRERDENGKPYSQNREDYT